MGIPESFWNESGVPGGEFYRFRANDRLFGSYQLSHIPERLRHGRCVRFPDFAGSQKPAAILSLNVRLCWFHHGIRHPGTQAVRRRVQTVSMSSTRRGKGLPLPVHCYHLPSLRGAASVPAFRVLTRETRPLGYEAGSGAGTLKV